MNALEFITAEARRMRRSLRRAIPTPREGVESGLILIEAVAQVAVQDVHEQVEEALYDAYVAGYRQAARDELGGFAIRSMREEFERWRAGSVIG